MNRWCSLVVLACVSFGMVGCQEQKPAAPAQATDPMEMQRKMMEGMKGMGPTPQQLEEAKKQGLSVEGAPGAEPAAEGAKEEPAAEPAKEEAAAEPAGEEKKAE